MLLTIVKFSHSILVTNFKNHIRVLINSFNKNYTLKQYRNVSNRYELIGIKIFASFNKEETYFRFHINQYDALLQHLIANNVNIDDIEIIVNDHVNSVKVNIPVRPGWVPRNDQIPGINFLVDKRDKKYVTSLLGIQTGKGKTFSFLQALSIIGLRALIVVKPMYMEQWYDSVCDVLDIVEEDIFFIRGSKDFAKLIELGLNGTLSAKIIILSNKTWLYWVKEYENADVQYLSDPLNIHPGDLCDVLGIGVKLVDETHQDFHINFRLETYTNVEYSLHLTATLVSEDYFINRMYGIMIPPEARFSGAIYHKYTNVQAILYRFKSPDYIRTTSWGSNTYSHFEFEQSIMRHKPTLNNYFDMVYNLIKDSYLDIRQNSETCLVFFYSIQMCYKFRKYLINKHRDLIVNTFVTDDDIENLYQSDIVVSTIISAGTARDIPKLIYCLNTIALSSMKANLQALGRLREYDKKTPKFEYLVCEDIKKHIDYHNDKKELFKDKALTHREIRYCRSL